MGGGGSASVLVAVPDPIIHVHVFSGPPLELAPAGWWTQLQPPVLVAVSDPIIGLLWQATSWYLHAVCLGLSLQQIVLFVKSFFLVLTMSIPQCWFSHTAGLKISRWCAEDGLGQSQQPVMIHATQWLFSPGLVILDMMTVVRVPAFYLVPGQPYHNFLPVGFIFWLHPILAMLGCINGSMLLWWRHACPAGQTTCVDFLTWTWMSSLNSFGCLKRWTGEDILYRVRHCYKYWSCLCHPVGAILVLELSLPPSCG